MTVLDFVRLSRHNIWLLIASVIVGLLLATGYTATQPVLYKASSTGYLVAGDSETVNNAFSGSTLAQQRLQSYVPIVQTRRVANGIIEITGSKLSAPQIAGRLQASVIENTTLLKIEAIGASREEAQTLADAAIKSTAKEITELEKIGSPNAPSIVKLVPFENALLPSAPYTPDWRRNVGLGAAAGLLIGYLFAFIRRGLDTRLRSKKEVEEIVGKAVVGVVPQDKAFVRQRAGSGLSSLGVTGEAMRQIRTNLRYVNVDNPPRAIVVTSALPGEGKSTIASNLARVLADSGQRTLVIDADLRRPVQHKVFNSDAAIGLTQVLAGEITVTDAIQPGDHANLFVLTSGRIPPNPSELAGSKRMRHLIEHLSEDYLVIIDAPPMLPVTDAGLLGASSDGVLLVTHIGKTYREQLSHAVENCQQVRVPILGCVINQASKKNMGSVHYGYGHSYGSYNQSNYYADEDSGKRRGRSPKKQNGKAVGHSVTASSQVGTPKPSASPAKRAL